MWETRRAAVLAELGELKEAEEVAEHALDDIRSKAVSDAPDFRRLSQEGWTMLLLRLLKASRPESDTELDHYRDRWERLSAYRCNPWPDLELLEALVKQRRMPVQPKDIVKEFDPGRSSVRYHFKSNFLDEALPAFALLRMLEIGAVPIRAGWVTISRDAVLGAAAWIETFAPLWSIGARLRAGQKESLESALSRPRVAALSNDERAFLFRLSGDGLRRSQREATRGPRVGHAGDAQTELFGEVLSRIAFRMEPGQRREILELGISMYKSAAMRGPMLNDFFRRALFGIETHQLSDVIEQILELPIPGEAGFQVPDAEQWPEPVAHIRVPEARLHLSINRARLAPLIGNLLRVAATGTLEARGRAVWRLAFLYWNHVLNDVESTEFGDVLWSRLDSRSGLPS